MLINLDDKCWRVIVTIDEEPDQRSTHAMARLTRDSGRQLFGVGEASRFPQDPECPEVGDDLATARALTDLARQLTSKHMPTPMSRVAAEPAYTVRAVGSTSA